MKNLNLKHYQQAYHHPFDIPANNNNNTHQQQLQIPYTNSVDSFNSNHKCNTRNFSETYNYTPTNLTNFINSKSLPKSFNSISSRNNTQSPLLSSPPPPPPTLGGYLANQQQQRLQQQQQHLNQNLNQHTAANQQTHNMLSLNQTSTLNYNFPFNANCSTNSSNFASLSFNINAHHHTNSRNNYNNNSNNNNNNNNNNINIINTNNHNNRALSRPQRPNSLNISAMASLATPSSYSSCSSYSTTTQLNNESSCSSSCHSAPTASCNFSTNHFYNNPRENLFNFSINQQQQYQQQLLQNYNNHNYSLQQHQENYNNYQANVHQQQQQQQHVQQFQLLQQQLKQQQQSPQFHTNKNNNRNISNHNTNNNNNCNLTTPAAILSTSSSASLCGNSTTQCTISSCNDAATSTANSNSADGTITEQSSGHCDKLTMDAGEIANFLANELFMQQLVSMECMQTGVPTLTTPTLTPTTLKSIEESFIQLTSEPINAPYQAGFIPPPLGSYISTPTNTTNNNNNSVLTTTTTSVAGISPNAALNNVYVGDTSTGASLPDYGNINDTESENSQGSWTANNLNEENSMATTDTSSAATDTISFQNGLNGLGVNTLNNSNSSTNEFTTLAALAVATAAAKISNSGNHNNNTSSSATTTTTTPTRRGGGRRPTTNSNMTPEEEEKRRIRRERNKLAAARCRKRRVDQTNELTEEVQLLEKKREELQKQIESLNGTKQDLEFLLEAHRPTCQRVEAADILSVNTFEGLMPATIPTAHDNITGIDTSLATTARSISPLDLKPVLNDQLLAQIKDEPLDSALDSNSSLDQDGPPSTKRLLLSNNNPMIPPALPNVATLSASLAAASASLNTPIVTAAPVNFGSMYSNNPSLCAPLAKPNSKQRPNSLPTIPRSLAQTMGLNVNENKPPTDINGVAIQTPSTGMFNFDSLMDGGTGLTPVSGPLVPNCSSQNKHPLELVTPTSEPSKLVSL